MTANPALNGAWLRLLGLIALFALGACIPQDPDGTTEAVEGRTLRVGALVEPLDAVDANAVARIAAGFGAAPEILRDDPHALVAMVEDGRIHLLVGDLPDTTPFKRRIALSAPLGEVDVAGKREKRVVGLRKGENRFLVRINKALEELR